MVSFKLFHGGQELSVSCVDQQYRIDRLVKIATQNEHIFLLSANKNLLFGSLTSASASAIRRTTHIQMEVIRNDVIDIDCSNDSIYVVDAMGAVQHCPLMAFTFDKHWNDVPIYNYDVIYNGEAEGESMVRIERVNCNNDGVLFTTQGTHELYGMGNFGEVCTSDQPMKIAQFINYEVLKVSMGKNFALVLMRRRDTSKLSNGCNDRVNHRKSSTTSLNTLNVNDVSVSSEQMLFDKSDDNLSVASQPYENGDSGGDGDRDNFTNINESSATSSASSATTVTINKTNATDMPIEKNVNDDAMIAYDVEYETEKVQRVGHALIRTFLWSFGSENTGRLGVGDHMKRKQAVQIRSLCEQGVRDVCCGDDHAAALTLDGRLYLWGDNSNEQISHWMETSDYSSPKRYYKSEQSVLQVQCGQYSTCIMTNNLDRFEFSRNKYFASIPIDRQTGDGDDDGDTNGRNANEFTFFANKQLLAIGNAIRVLRYEKYLKFEQQFLQDILLVGIPFFTKFTHTLINDTKSIGLVYKEFFRTYQHIADLTAINIETMLKYACGVGETATTATTPVTMACVGNYQEFIYVYRMYTKQYCEIICSNFYQTTCNANNPNTDFASKFQKPLHHITNYVEVINELATSASGDDTINNYLKSVHSSWCQFRLEVNEKIANAERTCAFWQTNAKHLPPFLQTPSRRIVIDSKELPLKLLPTSRFTTNWFILFNDVFCHSTGSNSTIKQYPLRTLWVSDVPEKAAALTSSSSSANNQRNYLLKITTPEEQFVVSAATRDAKMQWFQLIEQHIKIALGKANAKTTNLMLRVTTHTFSDKHKLYPNCKYIGQWHFAKMHGTGHLQWPDERVFTGQFDTNVISGQGRLVVPNVSCYEGQFVNGKYHGSGTMKLQHLNGTIEGWFKNGLEHGHCTLIDDHKTYYGEYLNGARNGYGVLDDSNSGEKYMGMFQDDRRHGAGVCITDNGHYFEGTFVDNELNGNGLAIFSQGMYYEGDMVVHGPSGRGTLYLPGEPVRNDTGLDSDEHKSVMVGNVMYGSLGGNWNDVKINNGSIAINREMPKYSQLFGTIQIDDERKWLSLFSDWTADVFGENGLSENIDDDYEVVWHRIDAYIRRAKQTEELRAYISSTAVLFESGQNHRIHAQQTHSDHFLGVFYDNADDNNSNRQSVSRSISLSRITGKKYKRNLMAIDSIKSISNEFLNTTNAFDQSTECNNNGSGDRPAASATDRDNLSIASITLPTLMAGSKSAAPCFGTKLDKDDLRLVRDYLTKAFKNQYHPLGVLNAKISFCFYTSYGCWKVKPNEILSTQAMKEWESISKRIYSIVRHMFPALPSNPMHINFDDEFISHRSLLYPILLSDVVYSTLFVLYANKCSKRDEVYRQRVLYCDKKSDAELMDFLKISSNYLKMVQHDEFQSAIETLRQMKEQFCPREMLQLIEQTYRHIEMAAEFVSRECQQNDETPPPTTQQQTSFILLNADNMMPLSIFLLLRASIPHLGTEIQLLEDLIGSDAEFVMKGFAGYCFTTIKAAYQHIIHDTFLQQ